MCLVHALLYVVHLEDRGARFVYPNTSSQIYEAIENCTGRTLMDRNIHVLQSRDRSSPCFLGTSFGSLFLHSTHASSPLCDQDPQLVKQSAFHLTQTISLIEGQREVQNVTTSRVSLSLHIACT